MSSFINKHRQNKQTNELSLPSLRETSTDDLGMSDPNHHSSNHEQFICSFTHWANTGQAHCTPSTALNKDTQR